MNVVDELRKLQAREYYLIVLVALATILPGYLILFVFKRDLFLALDTFKLFFLGAAISVSFQ